MDSKDVMIEDLAELGYDSKELYKLSEEEVAQVYSNEFSSVENQGDLYYKGEYVGYINIDGKIVFESGQK